MEDDDDCPEVTDAYIEYLDRRTELRFMSEREYQLNDERSSW